MEIKLGKKDNPCFQVHLAFLSGSLSLWKEVELETVITWRFVSGNKICLMRSYKCATEEQRVDGYEAGYLY